MGQNKETNSVHGNNSKDLGFGKYTMEEDMINDEVERLVKLLKKVNNHSAVDRIWR